MQPSLTSVSQCAWLCELGGQFARRRRLEQRQPVAGRVDAGCVPRAGRGIDRDRHCGASGSWDASRIAEAVSSNPQVVAAFGQRWDDETSVVVGDDDFPEWRRKARRLGNHPDARLRRGRSRDSAPRRQCWRDRSRSAARPARGRSARQDAARASPRGASRRTRGSGRSSWSGRSGGCGESGKSGASLRKVRLRSEAGGPVGRVSRVSCNDPARPT